MNPAERSSLMTQPWLRVLLGAVVGLGALTFDQLVARWALGFFVPIPWRFIGCYLAVGAVLGAVSILAGRRLSTVRAAGLVAAGLYVMPIAERLLAFARWPNPQGLLVFGSIAVVAVAVGLWVMAKVLGPAADYAGFGVAAAAAVGLSLNRNWVASPLEAKALLINGAVLLGAIVWGWLGRRLGGGRISAVTVAAILSALSVSMLWPERAPSFREAEGGPPNLVLIVIDTLRWDVFNEVVRNTPEGQRFEQVFDGAAWFNQAIAAAPWTAPSMGSIMTGLYPREHGLIKPAARRDLAVFTQMSDEIPTLAEKLGRRNYQNVAVVANPILHPKSGISRGFDRYEVLAGPTVKLPLLTALARARWIQREFYQQARWVRERTRHEVGRLDPDRPAFLWLHWMDPHDPLYEHQLSDGGAADEVEAELPELDRLYRREVRYTLAELTRTIEMLERAGFDRNTAWILTSDHGEMFPSDGRDQPGRVKLRKTHGHGHALYEELTRIPLVIRPPERLPSKRAVRTLTHHTDLHDTIADLLAVDLRKIGADRISLLPWLQPELPAARPPIRTLAMSEATHSGPEQRALRTLRWKMIDRYQSDRPVELYDLAKDPREENDLTNRRRGQAGRLQERLDEFWHGLQDPPATADAELDEETRRQLEALGYL